MSDGIKAGSESTPESKPKRKHVATGTGKGGRRPGAGRPQGSRDVLPRGSVEALNAALVARRRLGENASPEDLAALEYVYSRVGDVLAEKVYFQAAGPVLKAAAMAGDALAGPIAQKVEATGANGGPLEIVIRDFGRQDAGGEEE